MRRLYVFVASLLAAPMVASAQTAPGWTFQVLHEFSLDEGTPLGPLLLGSDGALYGVTQTATAGSVFRLRSDGTGGFTYEPIYQFPSGRQPTSAPVEIEGELYVGAGLYLYGISMTGVGVVWSRFTLGPVTTLSVLPPAGVAWTIFGIESPWCRFEGGPPWGEFVWVCTSGYFRIPASGYREEGDERSEYGAPLALGGAVLETLLVYPQLYTSGNSLCFRTLTSYYFPQRGCLATPMSPGALARGDDGRAWGVDASSNTLFRALPRLTPLSLSSETVTSLTGTVAPEAAVVQGTDGAFYGAYDAIGGHGAAFRATRFGELATVHTFSGADGATPNRALSHGSDGSLYGVTSAGGGSNSGVLFRLTRAAAARIVISPSTARIDQTVTLAARLLDPTGAPIAARRVDFYVDDVLKGTSVTDSGGFATLSDITAGTGVVDQLRTLASFAGDSTWPDASAGSTLDLTGIPPALSWSPTPLRFEQRAGLAQLNATSSESGTFTYFFWRAGKWHEFISGNSLPSGSNTVRAEFTPLDQSHVARATITTTLSVTHEFVAGHALPYLKQGDVFLYNPTTGVWSEEVAVAGGRETLATGQWAPGWQVFQAKFNADDLPDLFLYNPSNGLFFKLFNLGNGSWDLFGYRWAAGWHVTMADFNGDGLTDVFVYNPNTGNWFQCVTTAGKDFAYTSGRWAPEWSVYAVDWDADGRSDLFVYNPSRGWWFRVYSLPDLSFGYSAMGVWGRDWTIMPGDFSGDGRSDLFLWNGTTGRNFLVYLLNGEFAYFDGAIWLHPLSLTASFGAGGRATLIYDRSPSGNPSEASWTPNGWLFGNLALQSCCGLPPPAATADIDGDGIADLLMFDAASGEWAEARSNDRTLGGSWTWRVVPSGTWPVGSIPLLIK